MRIIKFKDSYWPEVVLSRDQNGQEDIKLAKSDQEAEMGGGGGISTRDRTDGELTGPKAKIARI